MLCLHGPTKPGWIENALKDIPGILADHAHCEKKAAATGLSLLSTYPDKTELTLAMADLVEEEIGHFRSVVQIMEKMGLRLSRDRGDEYARELLSAVSKNEPDRMLDRLLVSAIIEARSCERLQILAGRLDDPSLASFYKELADTEAGHYVTFTRLAKVYFNDEKVKARLNELCAFEQSLINNLPNHPLMHG